MFTAARLAISAWRNEDLSYLLRVRGPDLSGGTALRLQVRLAPGTPGDPLISLDRVTDDTPGLKVIDTRVVDGVIETVIRFLVPAARLQALPFEGELGQPLPLAFAFQIAGKTRLHGELILLDSAIDSDGNSDDREPAYGAMAARFMTAPQQGATLTIGADDVAELTIDGADLLGPLATRAVDAIDTVEGIATTSYRAVATYGEREAIPLDKRAPGMLVRVLEGSTDGGRVFIWNPSFAMPGAWTGLLTEEEKMRLDLMHGGLGQDKVYGLEGSLDAMRDATAAVARVKVGNLRAELLAGGAATIAWTRDGARPDAQEVAWGDWSVPLSGDVERFDLHDWSKIDRLFVAGNSLSDTTGGNGQWSQLFAQQLGIPYVSVARGSSDARQVYKTGARPLLLTLGGQLPAQGSVAVTLINGVAPSLDSYVSPASFLNSYGGDATPASMTGYVTDGTTSRRVTVSIARSDSTDYRITQAAGGSAVTFAGPVLFTPDTVIEPARSLNALWLGNNYFYSGVPGAYGDNTNAQLWTDMAAIVRQWNGARGFILPILPSSDWIARGPGTPYDAYIAANARTRALYPRYWLTDAQGRDLVAYILQLGSDGSDSDKADIAKGFTPGSCRYDGLHLNAKGVGLVVAFLLAALPRQAMPPVLIEGMTVRLNASGAGTADSALTQVVRPASAALIDGVVSQSAYRPTLAAAVTDFEVGTFFTSRDMDGVSAYPGEKRQYEIIAKAPYWADRGPFVGKADVGLDQADNTADADKPVSVAQARALNRRLLIDAPQELGDESQLQARANIGLDLVENIAPGQMPVSQDQAAALAVKSDAAVSVAALAARPQTSASVLLTEVGRAGAFRWEPGDHRAAVSIDPRQAVTIAPASDPTGASGAWVRAYSGDVNVQWFGAKSDPTGVNVAANSAAFQAALDYAKAQYPTAFQGALRIYVPAGWYCLSNVVQSGGSITWTGDGEQISVIFNLHPSARCVRFQPGAGQQVATHVNLEGLTFANCVNRDPGAVPVFSLYQITRYSLKNVLFQSEDYAFAGPYAGDVLEVTYLCEAAFQSVRFRAGGGAGGGKDVCAGVAMTVVDAGQADSLDLDGLTMQGYALDIAFGVKSGTEAEQAGTNSTAIRSGKFLGYQGGSFLSGKRDAYAQGIVTSAVANAAVVPVSTTAGMKVGRAFVAGQNTRNGAKGGSAGAPQYGIITAIDTGNSRVTLDRAVTISNGDLFLSGSMAVLLGNVSLIAFEAIQFEGKDVGVISTGGLGISLRDCTLGAIKSVVSHGNFWNASIEGCRYTLGGNPDGGATKKLVTIRGTANASNKIRLAGNSFVPGAGLTGADITAWIDNQTIAEIAGGIDDWRYGVAQGTWGIGSVWKAASGAPVPIGNSIIDNGAMRLWQRGTGPFAVLASAVYSADRWFTTTDVAGTRTVSRAAVSAAEAEAGVQSQYAIDIEQQVGGGTYFILAQAEDEELFRAVNGKTVAFDAKIKLVSGAIGNVRAYIQQRFGGGGSPSKTFFGTPAVLTAGAYAAYSGQIAVGQASAFNIGSAPSILVGIDLPPADVPWRIAVTDLALTIGAQRYLFSPRPLVTDVAAAQRYYRTMAVQAINGSLWVPFGVPMARAPNVTTTAGTVSGVTRDGFLLTHTASAAVTVTAVCAEP
ncbi:hypothetical protein KZ810_12965 [Sphingomonas sp. RHCKR47]|uniref:hypothetical protein n=1 Tax=Sphingomonas citricola TaxID=2862498 RepID=UPI001CA5CF09|nr:hypothetical protein [Sphingomonas citricola]MBW6524412.1 hypothetical protein [Sphingomonas citricola]